MPQDVNAALIELAPLEGKRRAGVITKAEHQRSLDLIEYLMAKGVVLTTTVAVRPAGPPPRGCVRGTDGIIRSAPGVFEKRFAQALATWSRPFTVASRFRVIRRPLRRQTRPRRRVVRSRSHSSHAPPRRRPPPEPPLTDEAGA